MLTINLNPLIGGRVITNILKVFGVYSLGYVGLSIALGLFKIYVYDLSASGGMAGFFAAMFAGQYFARIEDRAPTPLESWGYSIGFMVCIAVISTVQLTMLQLPPEVASAMRSNTAVTFMTVYAVIIFISCRFFFPLGAKNALKAKEKKDGNG